MRAVPLLLAEQTGVLLIEQTMVKVWRQSFPGTVRNSLLRAIKTPAFTPDTTEAAIKADDAIEAICIGLHALKQRGYTFAVRSLSAMCCGAFHK